MEPIKFKKLIWVDDFLKKEGQAGNQADNIITDFQGALFEKLTTIKVLKQINNKPKIFALRIYCNRIFFRFFGPKISDCIYLLHVIKKKSDKIPKSDLETAIRRTKSLLEGFYKK